MCKYRKTKPINFLNYSPTKSFFNQTTFYLFIQPPQRGHSYICFLNKRRTPTSLYLFIQKDFSFEVMLKILHFSPYVLFNNSIERDTQLGQLGFQRGELRSLLSKGTKPQTFQSINGGCKASPRISRPSEIHNFQLEAQDRNRPVTFKLVVLLGSSS